MLKKIGMNEQICRAHPDEYHRNEHVSHWYKPAGRDRVATLWKKYLDHLVTKPDEGNERIVVTLFNLKKLHCVS